MWLFDSIGLFGKQRGCECSSCRTALHVSAARRRHRPVSGRGQMGLSLGITSWVEISRPVGWFTALLPPRSPGRPRRGSALPAHLLHLTSQHLGFLGQQVELWLQLHTSPSAALRLPLPRARGHRRWGLFPLWTRSRPPRAGKQLRVRPPRHCS